MRCHGLATDRARLFRCYPLWLVGSEPFLCALGLSDHGHTPGEQGNAAVLQEFLRSTSAANSASLLAASAASFAAAADWYCGRSNLVELCRVEPHLPVEFHQLLRCSHAIRALMVAGSGRAVLLALARAYRSEEHTSELQSLR